MVYLWTPHIAESGSLRWRYLVHSSLKRFWLESLIRSWSSRSRTQTARPRRGAQLGIETLEERLTPSTYTVTDASDIAGSSTDVTLRYAITRAVGNNDQNAVINFSNTLAGQTLTLSQNDISRANIYGPTAFVVNNAKITVDGSNAPGLILSGNNALRLFAVTGTGSLTLEDLTVENGLAAGGAGGASGGGMGGSPGAARAAAGPAWGARCTMTAAPSARRESRSPTTPPKAGRAARPPIRLPTQAAGAAAWASREPVEPREVRAAVAAATAAPAARAVPAVSAAVAAALAAAVAPTSAP